MAAGYAFLIEKMHFGPPLVMFTLGGMTLALTGAALIRVIDPLAGNSLAAISPARGGRRPRELEREKQLVLKAIKEIELDYQMRKIAERDYREMVERYRTRAMRLMSEIEAGDDFRVLIERELTMRLKLEAAKPASAPEPPPLPEPRRSRRPRQRQPRPSLRRPALPAQPSTTTTPASVRNAEPSSFKPDRAGGDPRRRVDRAAQPMMGGSGMPNLAEIVGRPLPDSGMPTGTVSVRVARKMPSNGVAGAEVSAVIKNAGGDLRRRSEKTDADGRALFEGMTPGDEFTRRGHRRRRAAEDGGVHPPAGGRAPHDADRRPRQGRRQCGARRGGCQGR